MPPSPGPRPARLFLLAVATALGCAHGGAAPDAAAGQPAPSPHLIARGIIPCLDATIARVDDLHAAGAPFGGAELRTMLLARLDLPESALQMIDTSQPIGFALVERPGRAPAAATAVIPRGVDAARFAGRLGTTLLQKLDVAEVQLPDGAGAVWVRATAAGVVVGATFDDVVAAGDEAAAARAGTGNAGQDLGLTTYPAALARTQGIELARGSDEIVRQLLARYDQPYAAAGRPSPANERAALAGTLAVLVRPLPDTDVVEAALTLGAERGITFTARLRPRAGTPFAARVAAAARYELPASLASGGDALALAAFGASFPLFELLQSTLDAQARANLPGAVAAAAGARALFTQLTGEVALAVRATKTAAAYDLALPLKPGADPAATLEAFAAFAAGPGLGELLRSNYGAGAPTVSVTREGTEVRADLGYTSREAALITKALHGSSTLSARATVAQGRLLVTLDPSGHERLAALAGAGQPIASAPLTAALAETRGREGFVYDDVWDLFRFGTRALSAYAAAGGRGAGDSARLIGGVSGLLGLARLPMPSFVSVSGGNELGVEARVPLVTLKSVGTLLHMFGFAHAGG
jgi:hypothetical protein